MRVAVGLPASRADGRGDEVANVGSSDMEDIRDAIAEAIQEVEIEEVRQEIRREGGGKREEAAAEREKDGSGDQMGHTERRRRQQQEHLQQRDTKAPDLTTVRPTAIPGNSATGQTPLQLMQQRSRE